LIKQALPDIRTILGISNVSFGLPAGAREVVNSVFLYYCKKAGLDLAIVNTEKLERFASIPAHDRELAENLLFSHPPKDVSVDHSNAGLLQNVPAFLFGEPHSFGVNMRSKGRHHNRHNAPMKCI
jgi:5-methyltetrahydrofolate--homocysteine methyltransferase